MVEQITASTAYDESVINKALDIANQATISE